jgi:hypothetical protein
MSLFEPKQSSNIAKGEEIRSWIADLFGLQEEAVVLVSELRCTEPGCQPLETVITMMGRLGQEHQFKIHKSINEVLFVDVAELDFGKE